jgi:hypothetical protein
LAVSFLLPASSFAASSVCADPAWRPMASRDLARPANMLLLLLLVLLLWEAGPAVVAEPPALGLLAAVRADMLQQHKVWVHKTTTQGQVESKECQ